MQDPGALRRGGTTGEHIVDQDHSGWWAAHGMEGSSHGQAALGAGSASLRRGLRHPIEQAPERPAGEPGDLVRQRQGLVVAS
jgi:hypothetical protein